MAHRSEYREWRHAAVLLCALAGLLAWAQRGAAENLVEPLALESAEALRIEGNIDWTERVLAVYGEGLAPEGIDDPARRRLMGMKAARVMALRNLAEMVGEVRIDAQTKVSMAMVESDEVYAHLSAIVRGARVVPGSMTDEDGLYRIAVQIDLRNDFAAAVLSPTDSLVVDTLDALLAELDSLNAANAEVVFLDSLTADSLLADSLAADSLIADTLIVDEPEAYEPLKPYTGLVVDVRGLDLRPSMAPRILSPGGLEVYGGNSAEGDCATQIGVVGYDKDMERVLSSDRVGGEDAHPMVVEASGVSGLYNADVVLSSEDAVNVRMADREWDFLGKCGVVLVVGPKPAPIDPTYFDPLYMDSTYADTTYIEEDDFDLSGEIEGGGAAE